MLCVACHDLCMAVSEVKTRHGMVLSQVNAKPETVLVDGDQLYVLASPDFYEEVSAALSQSRHEVSTASPQSKCRRC